MIDPTVARVESALADSIRAREMGDGVDAGMVGNWVLCGVYTDQDGEERHIMLTAGRQPLHITLGLLQAGDVVWREALRRWVTGVQREADDD